MERLIQTVRKYPCPWKLDSEEYKLIDFKEAAWIEVAKECDLANVAEAQALWKKLRDGHRQGISKKKTVSGPSGYFKASMEI
ncbi:unnamed protein product [Arctia plantaginis]|uniref:MADF domain-containing protein n=1 Tax=Arctia plantaginis TaxID=874455 RepID=A0A8S1A3U9_ARCPL|nr:unnamed protein product [Arctia plantaginis]